MPAILQHSKCHRQTRANKNREKKNSQVKSFILASIHEITKESNKQQQQQQQTAANDESVEAKKIRRERRRTAR